MKYTLLLLTSFFLVSCQISEPGKENTKSEVTTSSESIKVMTTHWDSSVTFIKCDNKNIPKNLQGAAEKLSDDPKQWGGVWGKVHFGRFVREYCITKDGDMVFYSDDKAPTTFGRYSYKQDILEPASFHPQFLPFINFFDAKEHGFGKKSGAIIPLTSFQMPYKPHQEKSFLKSPFQNEKNEKFCKNGLTPTGKAAECFIEMYYEYDFVKNTVRESKLCAYWKNDVGDIVPLEKCLVIE